MIELGYALKALGHEKIVLVFNTASGKVEEVPFDLKMRRIATYNLNKGDDKKQERKALEGVFEEALTTSFSMKETAEADDNILHIIETNQANKVLEIRRFTNALYQTILSVAPKMPRNGGTVEDLLQALEKTQEFLTIFPKVAEVISMMNDTDAGDEMFKLFGKLYEHYEPEGQGYNADGDYYKFIGHELFVMFVSAFIKEEKWALLQHFLKKPIKSTIRNRQELFGWSDLYDYSPLLADEGKKRGRMSLHSDMLDDRHGENGVFEHLSPFKDFAEADFFLSLHGKGKAQQVTHNHWYPISALWLKHTPSFLIESESKAFAEKLMNILQIETIEDFKARIHNIDKRMQYARFSPIHESDIDKIGSTP